MADDLVKFLRERLDEDERIARGHRQASPSWQNFDMDGELRDDVNAGTVATSLHPEDRDHIARHDPARVLRDIEAKRRILAQYASAVVTSRHAEGPVRDLMEGAVNTYRHVLAALALPYAGHPEFQEDWRP